MVERAGDYAWSKFRLPRRGACGPVRDAAPGYDALAAYAVRQRCWSAYVQQEAEEAELAAIRRSGETGLPYGEKTWVDRLCGRLKLDSTIRPRGRPRKDVDPNSKYSDPLFPQLTMPTDNLPPRPAEARGRPPYSIPIGSARPTAARRTTIMTPTATSSMRAWRTASAPTTRFPAMGRTSTFMTTMGT